MKRTILFFSLLIMSIFSFAQVPQSMPYQALVKNADNSIAATQAIGVQVTILQNGTAVYTENQTITTDDNGVLTMSIGTGTATTGDFSKIDWSLMNYSLKVEIDPDGGTNYALSTEQSLLSVPYALYAENSADAFSRDYNDLKNTPEIPTVPENISAFKNDVNYITKEAQQLKLDDMTLSITDGVSGIVNSVDLPKGEFDYYDVDGRPLANKQGDMLYWDADANCWKPITGGENMILTINDEGQLQWISKDHAGDNTTPETPDEPDEKPCGELQVTDADGNVYNTILIGTQCWMTENMKATHYDTKSEGKGEIAVFEVRSLAEMFNPSYQATGGKYYYNFAAALGFATGDEAINYTAESGVRQGICPNGWHVGTFEEWRTLESFVTNTTVPNVISGDKVASGFFKALSGTGTYGKFNLTRDGQYKADGTYDSPATSTVMLYATPVPADYSTALTELSNNDFNKPQYYHVKYWGDTRWGYDNCAQNSVQPKCYNMAVRCIHN